MIRKQQILLIGIIFFGSIFFMLSQLDKSSKGSFPKSTAELKNLQKKLSFVEKQLEANKLAMKQVRDSMNMLLENGNIHDSKQRARLEQLLHNNDDVFQNSDSKRISVHQQYYNNSGTCPILSNDVTHCDIDMLKVYRKLPFDDPDGGVWKQGYPITTSDLEWKGRKLKVFVVPHSHNDPGWIKTVEKYFFDQTRHILDNVVDSLSQDHNRRFIWAEMSYLSMWWNIASSDRKIKMKQLVDNGQLEMVTAGWVMNDEANTHYFAMIDQMIEGNEWLNRNLGVAPTSGWAIDPFGHTPTMAYLLKKMNFKNMLIQRVHYAIKKHLSLEKSLEFRWRQSWCPNQDTDIVCHMMPFYSYDVPHTCGPDPKICCQFDFARLGSSNYYCPWRVPPVAINDQNVATRSAMLLDQYRKKSKLFKSDTLLVILGDDFRYDNAGEAKAQFENYAKIFNYVNSHPDLHAELKFGTLSEYFEAMKQEIGGEKQLPALTGDFFTYADRQDHYWSGYYTSRPYHKMQDRVLEAHLRGAEILFSLALPRAKSSNVWSAFTEHLYPLLVEARQHLGLFQHHDGITGTAKDHVVIDYGKKMMKSIMDTKKIQMMSAQILLFPDLSSFKPDVIAFDYDEIFSHQHLLPDRFVIEVSSSQDATVVIYNSLTYARSGVVSLLVSVPYVVVTSGSGEVLQSQVNLVWKDSTSSEENKFELLFLTTLPAVGMATFKLKYEKNNARNSFSKISLYNSGDIHGSRGPFQVASSTVSQPLVIENDKIEVTFSPDSGYMQSITNKATKSKKKVDLEFVTYRSRNAKDKSGAYLFLPSGPATPHVGSSHKPPIRLISGLLSSEVHVTLPNVLHRVAVYVGDGAGTQPLGVHIRNDVDVRNKFDNKEIAMRFTSDIQSGDKFYTDLNGFQIQQRTHYDKLPLQANFYPIPSMAFIQDHNARFSLLSAQPLGVSSLKQGQLEVIMDRRLMQDDNRGVGQGVTDNVVTPESFVILLEDWGTKNDRIASAPLSYPSLAAHRMTWELLHPIRSMSLKGTVSNLTPVYSPLHQHSWPCDVHLLNLRSIQSRDALRPTDQAAMLLHRVGRECRLNSDKCFKTNCDSKKTYDIDMTSLFSFSDVVATSLSLQKDGKRIGTGSSLEVKPMEIEAYKIKLTSA